MTAQGQLTKRAENEANKHFVQGKVVPGSYVLKLTVIP